ncbi:hypothetical protein OSB04_000213 [Centaurea solstitialis]|uniref:TF-B3 domain-containing protein n=1 Tax=Centaurea solstitialis TaxID=347529 RepID=A0AA38WKG6_9ASTR|nr:hypothetical protein OSB04_000213 [Centaurea solstitialis]
MIGRVWTSIAQVKYMFTNLPAEKSPLDTHSADEMTSRRKPTNFYSVILSGNFNKTSIRIPNRFIRGHRKKILLNDVVLIVSDEKVWHSGWMVSGDGKLWLQKGWPEFAHHYRIRYGHLLLFKHLGKSVFRVTIFDSSNCEIDSPIETPKLKKEIDQYVTEDDEIEGKVLNFLLNPPRFRDVPRVSSLGNCSFSR